MGYRVLRFKLRGYWSFRRWATSNQDVGANNAIKRWKIRSRTFVARGRSEITRQLLLCNGAIQVSRTTHAERWNAKEALPRNHWHIDVDAGYVGKVDQAKLNETKDKLQWYLPYHPVINPHKPKKVRILCNAAAKYHDVALNDNLLSGPDLLQSLIGINFRFRGHQIALSADLEATFLQVAVPNDDSRFFRFLWREDPERRIEVYEYTRHDFGAKISPICTNYALHQVAKDNAVNDESIVRTDETSTWTTYLSQSKPLKKQSKSTRKSETSSSKWIQFDEMDNKWRRSKVTDTRDRQVNKSGENFGSWNSIILNTRTKLECGHRQSDCLSWNWARSSSKNNSENCPIICPSSVRPLGI